MTSNAERQKAHRERMKAYRDELANLRPDPEWSDEDWLDETASHAHGVQVLLATLAELAQHGKVVDAATSFAGSAMSFELVDELNDNEPAYRHKALTSPIFKAWIDPAGIRLWQDGAPVRLQIRIEAIFDKRKLNTTAKRLEREAEENEDED